MDMDPLFSSTLWPSFFTSRIRFLSEWYGVGSCQLIQIRVVPAQDPHRVCLAQIEIFACFVPWEIFLAAPLGNWLVICKYYFMWFFELKMEARSRYLPVSCACLKCKDVHNLPYVDGGLLDEQTCSRSFMSVVVANATMWNFQLS